MTEVALYEAKNQLSALIERVRAGEVILITRRGKVVAQIALPPGAQDDTVAQDAVDRLLKARQGVRLGGLRSRDLIAEGRR